MQEVCPMTRRSANPFIARYISINMKSGPLWEVEKAIGSKSPAVLDPSGNIISCIFLPRGGGAGDELHLRGFCEHRASVMPE
jgi:hypothetical protein